MSDYKKQLLNSYDVAFKAMQETALLPLANILRDKTAEIINESNDGNLPRFMKAIADLPKDVRAIKQDLNTDIVSINTDADTITADQIDSALRQLIPWRKGPLQIDDILIDSEWRSDMKWQRLEKHISSLEGRNILDVGSGNGYFGWRMRGAGARFVLGVDPSWLSVVQFLAINHFMNDAHHVVLPLKMEDLPSRQYIFDTVFSMGVLYHRRSPLDHIDELYSALRPGGELIMETLVVEGEKGVSFLPPGRYARMNNVYFLPSPATLQSWLEKIGFDDVRIVDVSKTSFDEQRATEWKTGHSLRDYMDQHNPNHTIEGHPPPLRAILIAKKPEDNKRLERYIL